MTSPKQRPSLLVVVVVVVGCVIGGEFPGAEDTLNTTCCTSKFLYSIFSIVLLLLRCKLKVLLKSNGTVLGLQATHHPHRRLRAVEPAATRSALVLAAA